MQERFECRSLTNVASKPIRNMSSWALSLIKDYRDAGRPKPRKSDDHAFRSVETLRLGGRNMHP